MVAVAVAEAMTRELVEAQVELVAEAQVVASALLERMEQLTLAAVAVADLIKVVEAVDLEL
jgi:hypothetical protein